MIECLRVRAGHSGSAAYFRLNYVFALYIQQIGLRSLAVCGNNIFETTGHPDITGKKNN
jgi:hypothetical protein